jgi:predicted Zn-dependent protease
MAEEDVLSQLPDLGSSSGAMISDAEEERVGASYIRQLRHYLDFVEDPELLYYINQLGQKLVKASGTAEDFSFYLINDDTLNAFAIPGGYIAVHTGLIERAGSEAELASVLSHEIAHVTQHHIARGLEKSRFQGIAQLAALIAAAAVGSGQAAQAAIMASQAVAIDQQLRFSREFEREADSLGIRTLYNAGYDPQAMPEFFSTMQQWSRIRESGTPEYLRSHPLTVNRIAESASRAMTYPEVEPGEQSGFEQAQAKIAAVYSKDRKSTVKMFAARVNDEEEVSAADRYGYALALSRANRYDEARDQLTTLIQDDPDNWGFQLAYADNDLEDQKYDQGLEVLGQIREQLREDQLEERNIIDIYYMNALVLTERYDEAVPLLRKAIRKNPSEPMFHILIARAYGETGNSLRAYQARGEFHFLEGNLGFALKQYERALSLATTYYDRESLRARIEDVKQDMDQMRMLNGSRFAQGLSRNTYGSSAF